MWSPEEVVAYAYGEEREPWDYPNTSFLLAGMIVEKATGETIGDEIQERIIKPLGLNNTFYSAQPPQIPQGTARGYAVLPNGSILDEDGNGIPDDLTNLSPSFFSVFGPAGAIVSNAPDLARFNQALFSGELLETDSFNQMRTFVDTPKDYDFDYGLGLMSQEFPTLGKALGHAGDLGVLYHSDMWYFPDTGVTFVGLQNNGRFAGSYDPLLALNTLLKEELQENPKSVPEPGFIAGFIVVGAAGLLLKRKRPILQIQTTVKTKPHPSQETKAA
jgi:D-alanyl-D-alanine carboxypeptidase